MSPAATAAVLAVGLVIFFGVLGWVVMKLREDHARRLAAARRRRATKPGPARRAHDREVILARADELRRDAAAGIISPIAPRQRKARA